MKNWKGLPVGTIIRTRFSIKRDYDDFRYNYYRLADGEFDLGREAEYSKFSGLHFEYLGSEFYHCGKHVVGLDILDGWHEVVESVPDNLILNND